MDTIYQQYHAALPRRARLVELAWEVNQLQAQAAPQPPEAPLEETLAAHLMRSGKVLAPAGLEVPISTCTGLFAELVKLFSRAELLPSDSQPFLDFWRSLPPPQWLDPDEATVKELAHLAAPSPVVLIVEFIARQTLTPFYRQWALQYQDFFNSAPWGRGVCPFCGQEPVLARLAEDAGRRFLYCGLCSIQWPFLRLTCPFCFSHDHNHLSCLHQDRDPARRVDLCSKCRRYIKTIDERRLKVPLHLPLEEFVTLELDHLAGQRGFH